MKQIGYNIDNMYFGEINGKIWFCINGWYLDKDNLDYDMTFFLDGKKYSDIQIRRISRDDICVAAGIQQMKGELLGFRLNGECEQAELRQELRIEFKSAAGKKKFSVSRRKIEQLINKAPFFCSVDSFDIENEIVIIRGWAVDLEGGKIDYKVLDNKGKNVEVKKGVIKRPDVQEIFQMSPDSYSGGFQVEFCCQENVTYKFLISTKRGKISFPIDLKKIRKEARKADRKYMHAGEIVKSITVKQIDSDIRYLLRHGVKELKKRWKERYISDSYEYWRMKNTLCRDELEKQRKMKFPYNPLVSIVVPVYQTPKKYLKQMIESVQKQTYDKWELCIADGSEDNILVENVIKEYLNDKRIKYKKLKTNERIAGNTNRALEMASGEFIGFLDHDDLLAENALYEMIREINQDDDVDVLYSDEDKITADSLRYMDPYFKSDFNLDLLRSNNYICHFLMVRGSLVKEIGGFDQKFEGAQDHDFILRCSEKARKIVHVSKILYHWRVHHNSTAGNISNKSYCDDAGKRAVEAHLKRIGLNGTVYSMENAGFYRTRYEINEKPLVSIMIPNRNEKDSLQKCINSLMARTNYDNYEIIIIENNSTELEIFEYYKELENFPNIKVIYWKKEFNYSAINNFGAREANGEYLVLLNNDTEIIEPEWLPRMLGDCQRKEVGIVGAKLYYPDDTIQHAGVIIGIGGVAGHIFKYLPRNYSGYFMKAQLQQDLSAVTAACLMVKKEVFVEVNGMEKDLKVAFNDVDFCLKVREKGYLVVFEPGAELYHYESKSRGSEDTEEKIERFNKEADYMKKKWRDILAEGDPYYNRNLTLLREDCSLEIE